MQRKTIALLSMAALLAVSGCQSGGYRAFHGLLNKPAPDFELDALGGGTVRLSKLLGKPIVLAFFSPG